jgi:hypothetical protein
MLDGNIPVARPAREGADKLLQAKAEENIKPSLASIVSVGVALLENSIASSGEYFSILSNGLCLGGPGSY